MTAHQPKQPMIQIVVLIIWQDRDCNFFQQYGTAPLVSTQTNSDSYEDDSTPTVRPQQRQQTEASNYQTLQDYNDAVANAASELEKAQDVLNQTVNVTEAKGRHIKVRKMLIPKKPVCITEEELNGFEFEEGEDMREAGERLAASYVNFYIANDSVIVPQFDDEADSLAINVLKEAFPDRKIVGIYARDIIVGGGNIHCITQQIPV